MQLCQLEKTHKISNSKAFCYHKQTKETYILTIQPPSEFNRLLYHLNHPNLLLVQEFWEERGQICSVQRCENINDLQEIMQNNKFSENTILTILYQIISAMFYLEQQQIPITVSLNNVFLDEQLQVKIDVLNIVNAQLSFASPEVLRKEVESSGIWSAGCIAYYLMKCELPFSGANERSIAYNIIYREPPPSDFQEFPLVSAILKVIFIKNWKRRATTKQVLQFLASKSATVQEPVKLLRSPQSSVGKNKSSMMLSKIDRVEYSDKQTDSMKMDDKQSPLAKVLTLQEFEDQLSRMKGRPQSSMIDESNEIINKIKRMRPNSAITLTGKEFVRKNIKEEINQRRQVQSSKPFLVKKNTENFGGKHHKEVSIDLDNADKLKHSDTIRVYNLEYQDNAMHPAKNNKVFLKILKPKMVSAADYPKEQIQGMQMWKTKMNSMLI
ncbi:unnamed protein product (macronuclear) [Paramecium tetraurelia]|uniref:non-specific serine/threonine protein kinase n=1 Tax=Paramecium tetraurelia TaxID=5888 RepID=A0D5Q4_PARTE|nr:uncharacterized protein GSPATT00013801001 [Paramecium tetraurelia]CAK78371.1 unnamed protein product [Paramecium tetraurelia]|eukprot:XP_001445768.1 hypothetical protein (macronuclear) [Paramecium tetraurelia strain d4-2]